MSRRALIIHNPHAGWLRRGRLALAIEILETAGMDIDLRATTGPGDAIRLAARLGSAYDTVLAAGGDGTINEVINGLMALADPPPLGILPLGTANVLAHELGLPLYARGAAETIAAGRVRRIRPGLINGDRHFTMMVGAGFDARVVARVRSRTKRVVGKAVYYTAMAQEVLFYRPGPIRVQIGNTVHEAGCVIVARGHYYGGSFVVAPAARLDDPVLHVCLFERDRRWPAAGYLLALGLGRLQKCPGFRIVPTQSVSLEAATDQPTQIDGDADGSLPIDITVADRSVAILAPG